MPDPLKDLTAAGVSIWLDDLSRRLLTSGALHRLVDERHVVGIGLAGDVPSEGIILVASGRLQRLYQLAFDTVSVPVQSIGAEDAVRRGLSMAAESIWNV